jgi:hypothetical protein
MTWNDDQEWERQWWNFCCNTFGEETKQLGYAKRMGLVAKEVFGHYPVYDLGGASVLDIGGGPVSLLLKCVNFKNSVVVDPCDYPEWVEERYAQCEIEYLKIAGEKIRFDRVFSEVWCYNVLQHVQNPEKIIKNAKKYGKIIRIFEWVNMKKSIGHPQELKEYLLNEWLGGIGKTEQLAEGGLHGLAYYGIFKGEHFNE